MIIKTRKLVIAIVSNILILFAACDNPFFPDAILSSIAVTALPAKTQYNIGDDFEPEGIVVTATYNDGSIKTVTGYTLSGYNKTTTGNQIITVTYEKKIDTFIVNVIDPRKQTVAKPKADQISGEVIYGTTVTFLCDTEEAEIWYTVNKNSIPEKNGIESSLYVSPIEITADMTIKAIAVKDNMNDSEILEVNYIIKPLYGSATINGIYKIGEELTVITNNIEGANTPFIYQWKVGNDVITGETNEVYIIQREDAGKLISCVVTHSAVPGSITATGQIIPYTILLNINSLSTSDSVSFNSENKILECFGNIDDIINIYYTLTGGNNTDILEFTFNDTEQKIFTVPGTSSTTYKVAERDAAEGVITIMVASMHANLIVLQAPTNVGFTKAGEISFVAGTNNNTASSTYTYTLYKNDVNIPAFTNKPIANGGGTVSGLTEEMLTDKGVYTVKITAHTTNIGYTASSFESVPSNQVDVYSMTVIITGANGTEKVSVNTVNHFESFTKNIFSGETVMLTAVPGTDRKVTWSGDGTDTETICTVANINADKTVIVTFAFKIPQTITPSTYDKTTTIVSELISSTDGTYVANDGGIEGTHSYLWKRSDNSNRTGNVTNIATTKNYTTVGADFGKYIWLETTPVGNGSLVGTTVQGNVLRVGIKLIATVSGAGGGSATINNLNGGSGVIIYGQTNIAVNKNVSTDTITWLADGNVGTFGSITSANTNYTPPANPSTGTITLTAKLTSAPGSESNPFTVATVADLQHVGKPEAETKYANWTLNSYYTQTADIDMTGITFTPIGKDSSGQDINGFKGTFNGNGYIISNLTINTTTYQTHQGLFGAIDRGGTVKNVALVGGSMTNNVSYSGGIAGYNNGMIENCYNTGIINSSNGFLGGIVGMNGSAGTIQNCYTTGNISGLSYLGGIAGSNGGTIKNCYATGIVAGTLFNVGGVVGYNDSSVIIRNCIALNVNIPTPSSDPSRRGRITGYNFNSTLTNNYARNGLTPTSTVGTTTQDGANVNEVDYIGANSGIWWRNTALFPDTEWNFEANKLPTLKNAGGTQNPTAPAPFMNAVTLTASVWGNGNITASGGEQYFRFTASDTTQYILISFGTLSDLYVQLYDSSGNAVGSQTNLSGSTRSTSRTLTLGQEYYIRVWPYSSSGSGTYKIAFNTMSILPTDVTMISTINTWTDGTIASSGGEQWFRFTATTTGTQYIHVSFGTLTDLYVHVYTLDGNAVGSQANLYNSTRFTTRTLTLGQEYYIRVWPYSSSGSGTYKIAFNTSSTAPSQ